MRTDHALIDVFPVFLCHMLSAGSDMRVRMWDISNPKNSYIMTHAAGDPANHAVVSYQTKIIEGTSVHQVRSSIGKLEDPEEPGTKDEGEGQEKGDENDGGPRQMK